MFREIRRKDRLIDQASGIELLQSGEYGILSVLGDEDYPYGVPVNYACADDCIYVHCFLEGHKVDAVRKHPKVCFTVVGGTEVMVEQVSTNYTSVIVFGQAEIVPLDDHTTRQKAFDFIMNKYIPGEPARTEKYIQAHEKNTNIIKITIEQMTCKRRDIK